MAINNSDKNQINPSLNLVAGKKIAHYKIIKPISSFGIGNAYLVSDTQLDKKVVLKILTHKLSGDDKRTITLSHPNIIAINEIGNYKNQDYLIMEYVKGKPLSEFIEEGTASVDFAIDVSIQISNALVYSHSENVIGGNIDFSNIIIDTDGNIKLLDFGISCEDKYFRNDLFSLGKILYKMLTGKDYTIENYDTEKLNRDLADLPDRLKKIITKLLNDKKVDRFETAHELLADLMSLPEYKKISGSKPVDWWNRYVVPLAFVILVIVAIYWLFYNYR